MNRLARTVCGGGLLLALSFPGSALAQDGASGLGPPDADVPDAPRSARLDRILDLAERNHPNLAEARARLAQTRAKLDEAHVAPFSQFKMTGGIALAPTVRGNNVYSPNTDVSLTSSLGVAWRATIDGVVPLWTFGKIEHLWDAAEANVALHEADLEKERDIIRFDVRRAYFGLQLARDSLILLDDARSQLDKAAQSLEKKLEEGDGDPIDLLKLQTFSAELEVRQAEAQKYADVALTGLRFYTGVPDLDIPDDPIAPPAHILGDVSRYTMAAKLYRPELAQAEAGLAAREAQVKLAQSMLFPDVGLGLSAGLSAAPEVANQLNPFVNDRGNYFHYGAALVFQWQLDFLAGGARVRYAEAQLGEMRATHRYAMTGVDADVARAYAEVVDWQARLEAYEKAVTFAKRWLIRVQQGIDIGTMEEDELLEPAKSYAQMRFNVINATMELDVAMSKLAQVTGWDAIAPDGLPPP